MNKLTRVLTVVLVAVGAIEFALAVAGGSVGWLDPGRATVRLEHNAGGSKGVRANAAPRPSSVLSIVTTAPAAAASSASNAMIGPARGPAGDLSAPPWASQQGAGGPSGSWSAGPWAPQQATGTMPGAPGASAPPRPQQAAESMSRAYGAGQRSTTAFGSRVFAPGMPGPMAPMPAGAPVWSGAATPPGWPMRPAPGGQAAFGPPPMPPMPPATSTPSSTAIGTSTPSPGSSLDTGDVPGVAATSTFTPTTMTSTSTRTPTPTSGIVTATYTPTPSLTLPAFGAISGKVTDALGTPIAGASVNAYSYGWCCGGGVATTAGDGTYQLGNLAFGVYLVYASASTCGSPPAVIPPCVVYPTQYYNVTYNYAGITPVVASSGATTTGIDFALVAGGTISGKVTNGSGTPIAGASVSAGVRTCCMASRSATTAADGTYVIMGLVPENYVVQASAPGYAPQYYDGTSNYDLAANVSVMSGAIADGINIALRPGGKITGTVTNALGTPIAGASVNASSDGWCCVYGSTTTALDGTYTIDSLATGPYNVQASAWGYASTYYNNTYDWNARTLVSATNGATTPGINFALVAGGKISGTVTNALSTPIAGASVSANSSGWCCGGSGTTTAGDGSYVIENLAGGSYTVQASAAGYAERYYNGTYDSAAATLVTATSSATTSGINIALEAGGKISGTITNASATPIAGAWVQACPYSISGYCRSAYTAADGTYLIDSLVPVTYRVLASAAGYVSQFYSGTSDYSSATPVGVTSGATTTGIDFALVTAGKISGTVTNALGTPIAGASVSVFSDPWCCFGGSATTAADGTYTIGALAAGNYSVNASAPGYAKQYYNGVYDSSLWTLVGVSNGATTGGINFALGPSAKISGKVTNAIGTPIAGASVQAYSDGWCCGGGSATSAVDGTYTIDMLSTGNYDVQASAPGYPAQFYNGVYDWSARTIVAATMGATTPNITFALAEGGKISGTVRNASATPIAGASVVACPVVSGGCGSANTAADGTYTIDSLAPGGYHVEAWAPGYPTQYYDNTYDWSAAAVVGVTGGATTPNIDFALVLGGSISGKVTNASSTPIAGAQVIASASTCCGSGGWATTAPDGTYTISGLAPASYTVSASASGCVSPPPAMSPPCAAYPTQFYNGTYNPSLAAPVAVSSGVTTPNIDFALVLGGSISGKVTNASSTPIAGAQVVANTATCCGVGGWATTAADGTYTLSALAPTSYIVLASVPSCGSSSPPSPTCAAYPAQYYNNTYDYSAASPVAVSSGSVTPNIDFALQPPNKNHPLGIGGLPFTDVRNTAGATLQPGESQPCGNIGATVWYSYTATSSPPAYNTTSIDTVGSGFNTAVAVYTLDAAVPSPPGALMLVGCNASGSNSSLTFQAAPGSTYYFQVGGQNGATGDLTVNISPDFDGDGYTNMQEIRMGKSPNVFCKIMRADINGDGAVNGLDLGLLAGAFLLNVPPADPRRDQNADSKINGLDLGLMASVFLQKVTACP